LGIPAGALRGVTGRRHSRSGKETHVEGASLLYILIIILVILAIVYLAQRIR
jgi:hypothetical protein